MKPGVHAPRAPLGAIMDSAKIEQGILLKKIRCDKGKPILAVARISRKRADSKIACEYQMTT
ncbi:MAG TPA: hypothetical protein VGS97_11895 [Actinocrinis sp.]|uniref:hypothetical protein n=1 Tax=Actinocrinis sp. TaxID=1920516 RepID=UPI002DDD1476|nr:hypothetical protein [Actinocrinis sp.]HEV2344787.1 hypothetical protein [Actinocrinis sp.]